MFDIGYKATAGAYSLGVPEQYHTTREGWLADLARHAIEEFPALKTGDILARRFRLGIGFPSTGRGSSVIGQCFHHSLAADAVYEIWIAPQYGQGTEMRVADILVHELCHVAAGIAAGHGKGFKQVARACELEGPLTATTGSEGFRWRMLSILARIGPMPHGSHSLGGIGGGEIPMPRAPHCPSPTAGPQTGRMVKCKCDTCGYIARTTRLWLVKAGAPICPTDGVPMTADAPPV